MTPLRGAPTSFPILRQCETYLLGFGFTLNVRLRKELGTVTQGESDNFSSKLLQELIYANYN